MGNLKGTAMKREDYLFKKSHPIRWKLRKLLKRLMKKL